MELWFTARTIILHYYVDTEQTKHRTFSSVNCTSRVASTLAEIGKAFAPLKTATVCKAQRAPVSESNLQHDAIKDIDIIESSELANVLRESVASNCWPPPSRKNHIYAVICGSVGAGNLATLPGLDNACAYFPATSTSAPFQPRSVLTTSHVARCSMVLLLPTISLFFFPQRPS